MPNNLKHIDDRLQEWAEKQKDAAERGDLKDFERASKEIDALTEMRKFYAREGE